MKSYRWNWEVRRLGFFEWLVSLVFLDIWFMVIFNLVSNDDLIDIFDYMIVFLNDVLVFLIVLFEGI